VSDQVSYPYKTTGKIIFLYILIGYVSTVNCSPQFLTLAEAMPLTLRQYWLLSLVFTVFLLSLATCLNLASLRVSARPYRRHVCVSDCVTHCSKHSNTDSRNGTSFNNLQTTVIM
jgi:hypothetical protein